MAGTAFLGASEEAIADLALATGDTVTVLIKASDVLIGK